MRIASFSLLALPILATQTACLQPAAPVNVYRVGEKVQAGPLIYTVFEAKWRAQIGEGTEASTPARRFLVVHLSVVNSGAEPISVPQLDVTDGSQTFTESMEAQGLPSWLGLIRTVKPANTLEGNVLFDLDPKSYKLKLENPSQPGALAMIELPLQFEAGESQMPSTLEKSR